MSTRTLGQCLVCDDNAVGINFAVPTCAACKAFFRRNAVKLGRRDFVCQQDGDCPVTYKSRRFCNCCRLAKCFRVGMQKALIRSDAERQARKQLVEQNRQKRVQNPVKKSSDLIRPSHLLVLSNNRIQLISPADQILLTNIYGAYERTCIKTKSIQSPSFPTSKHGSFHTFFNEYGERQKALVKFFKLIPEFERLPMTDKIRLIRNNFCMTLPINEATLSTNISTHLTDSICSLFNSNLAVQIIECIKIVHSYITDRSLLKLLLIIKILSTGINRSKNYIDMDVIYDDSLSIFAAQNIYVELLWKYLLTRYQSEIEAIKVYNKLIRDFLYLQSVTIVADSYINTLTDEINQMEPLFQSMWPVTDKTNNSDVDMKEVPKLRG